MQDMLIQSNSEAKCPVVTVTDPQSGKDNTTEWTPVEYFLCIYNGYFYLFALAKGMF